MESQVLKLLGTPWLPTGNQWQGEEHSQSTVFLAPLQSSIDSASITLHNGRAAPDGQPKPNQHSRAEQYMLSQYMYAITCGG